MKVILIATDFRADEVLLRNLRNDICNYIGLRFVKNPSHEHADEANNPFIEYDCVLTEDTKQSIQKIVDRYNEKSNFGVLFITVNEDSLKTTEYLNLHE